MSWIHALKEQQDKRVSDLASRHPRNTIANGALFSSITGLIWSYLSIHDRARSASVSAAMYVSLATAPTPVQRLTVSDNCRRQWVTLLPSLPFVTSIHLCVMDAAAVLPLVPRVRELHVGQRYNTTDICRPSAEEFKAVADGIKPLASQLTKLHVDPTLHDCLPDVAMPLLTDLLVSRAQDWDWARTNVPVHQLKSLTLDATFEPEDLVTGVLSACAMLQHLRLRVEKVTASMAKAMPPSLTRLICQQFFLGGPLARLDHLNDLEDIECDAYGHNEREVRLFFERHPKLRRAAISTRLDQATIFSCLESPTGHLERCVLWPRTMVWTSTDLLRWYKSHPKQDLHDLVRSCQLRLTDNEQDDAIVLASSPQAITVARELKVSAATRRLVWSTRSPELQIEFRPCIADVSDVKNGDICKLLLWLDPDDAFDRAAALFDHLPMAFPRLKELELERGGRFMDKMIEYPADALVKLMAIPRLSAAAAPSWKRDDFQLLVRAFAASPCVNLRLFVRGDVAHDDLDVDDKRVEARFYSGLWRLSKI